MTTIDTPVGRAAALESAPITPEELIALLDLRERVDAFFERAGRSWLDEQIATNPAFAHVTNKDGWVVEYDRDVLVYAYYADAWESRNRHNSEARIPLDQFVPGYGEIRDFLNAMTVAKPSGS